MAYSKKNRSSKNRSSRKKGGVHSSSRPGISDRRRSQRIKSALREKGLTLGQKRAQIGILEFDAQLAKGPSIADIYAIAFADDPADPVDPNDPLPTNPNDKYTIDQKIKVLQGFKEELKKYEPKTRSTINSKKYRIKLINSYLNEFLPKNSVIDYKRPFSPGL